MLVGAEDDGKVILSTFQAGTGERRLAFAIGILSLVVFAVLAPFAKIPLVQINIFIPAYETALMLSDLVTAGLLIRQFRTQGSLSLLVLSGGYLYTALIVVVHALTYPDVFSPTGLLGAGSQTTAWLYNMWHGGFPLVLVGFALLKERTTIAEQSRSVAVAAVAVIVVIVVAAFTSLTTLGHDLLPTIIENNIYTSLMIFVVGTTWFLSILALAVLWFRRSGAVLDTWLMVVMCAWICDIGLSAVFNNARYDLGFYAGRIYGMLAGGFILVVLLEPRFSDSRS